MFPGGDTEDNEDKLPSSPSFAQGLLWPSISPFLPYWRYLPDSTLEEEVLGAPVCDPDILFVFSGESEGYW